MIFSVVIPVYNRKEIISRAVDSVLAQNFKDFELIVVDDGSTDGTDFIEDFYNESIKYIKIEHGGVSKARNAGIRNSLGSYLAFLDSDDMWHSDKLQKQFQYIQDNPGVRIFQSQEIWIRNGVRVNPRKKHEKVHGDIFESSLEHCIVSPSSVVIEKSIFDKYGYFDEKMSVCEDYDLWLRITSFERVGLIDEYLATRFAGHDDQLSFKEWGMDRFRVYSILKLAQKSYEKLSDYNRERMIDILSKKSRILLSGAEKRNNVKLQNILKSILESISTGMTNSIDYSLLLEE